MATQKKEDTELNILTVKQGEIDICVLGSSPLIYNCMSRKGTEALLLPKGRKTAADKAASLKHVVIEEYRNSVYRRKGDDGPTRLIFPSLAIKSALSKAALDMPGLKKSQIGRLTYVCDQNFDVYGVPQMFMAVVRSADINRTPDVRTRAIVPQWAARFRIRYNANFFNAHTVGNLLASAGVFCGIGDFRQEKGKGNYGQFVIVDPDDAAFETILKTGGRAAQDEGLQFPECYDMETEELYSWYKKQVAERYGQQAVAV